MVSNPKDKPGLCKDHIRRHTRVIVFVREKDDVDKVADSLRARSHPREHWDRVGEKALTKLSHGPGEMYQSQRKHVKMAHTYPESKRHLTSAQRTWPSAAANRMVKNGDI